MTWLLLAATIIYPISGGVSNAKVQQVSASATQVCLVAEGAAHDDPANHFGCMAAAQDEIVTIPVNVGLGAGHLQFRAVAIDDQTVPGEIFVSPPSADIGVALDLAPPIILSP